MTNIELLRIAVSHSNQRTAKNVYWDTQFPTNIETAIATVSVLGLPPVFFFDQEKL